MGGGSGGGSGGVGGMGGGGKRGSLRPLELRPTTMISAIGENGRTPLHDAAFDDRIDLVFHMIKQYPNFDSLLDNQGWNPLHCAASQGHFDILMIFLTYEVSINRQTKSGSSVLHYLMRLDVKKRTAEKMQIYIPLLNRVKQKGAQLNIQSAKGIVPLHEAALHSNVDGARWLLSNHAKVNQISQSVPSSLLPPPSLSPPPSFIIILIMFYHLYYLITKLLIIILSLLLL